MKKNETLITKNQRLISSICTDPSSPEARSFVLRATQGPVLDKDKAQDVLSELNTLYRDIGMSREHRRGVINGHEEKLLGGTADEQSKTSEVLYDVCTNLKGAIRLREVTRRKSNR